MSQTSLAYAIPSNEEDPQERRRLLNILAQRRYSKFGALHMTEKLT